MGYKLLVINPGSTSTKIGIFEDETLLFDETLRHPTEEISKYNLIVDQMDFRKQLILDFLKEKNFDIHELSAVIGRGGLLKPIPGGTYKVSEALLQDLRIGRQGHTLPISAASLPMKSPAPWGSPPTLLTRWWWMNWLRWRVIPASPSCRGSASSTR